MPDEETSKMIVTSKYQKEIYRINNKIARVNATKKHYLAWKQCAGDTVNMTFIQYLDNLKESYQEEVDYYRKKLSEV